MGGDSSEANKRHWDSLSEEERASRIENLRSISGNAKGKKRSDKTRKKHSEIMSDPERVAKTIEINKKRKKYTEEAILEVLNRAGVKYSGDLSSSENTILIEWPTGETRRVTIKKFMKHGLRPPTNKKTEDAKLKLTELGIEVVSRKNKEATLRYKGVEWTQAWAGSPTPTTWKKIKGIDLSISIGQMLASGKKIGNIAKELNLDPTTLRRHLKRTEFSEGLFYTGRDYEQTLSFQDAIYNRQLPGYLCRPDIRFENPKVIVEIDGMVWHTEDFHAKEYHYDRSLLYRNEGYKFLAFSQFEVETKRAIVDSMIANALGKSAKVGARKCEIRELLPQEASVFFKENHLHGPGSGKTVSLVYNEEIVAALRWQVTKEGIFISRFCNKIGMSVVGGYSKLLNLLPKHLDIVNFVDGRHGDGSGLIKLGFSLVNTHIGFEWTDGYFHFNRRKYLGNSGYEHGMKKFYDYGQHKFILKRNK